MRNKLKKSRNSKQKEEAESAEEEAESAEEENNVAVEELEALGLDARLVRALTKKSIEKPTSIQSDTIPRILEGRDVLATAHTGSGKTFAYLLPMLQSLLSDSYSKAGSAPTAIVFVPTADLCEQVYSEVMLLIERCKVHLKVARLTRSMLASESKMALAGPPDILVSTPASVKTAISNGVLHPEAIQDSLSMLVLDEVDLLLSHGYADDIKSFFADVPKRCQRILMSATLSSDVEKLGKLVLHNPYISTSPEVRKVKKNNVQQSYISCSDRDKLLHILALLKLELVQKKALVFTNTIDMGFRLKLFLEQFGIKSSVLNAELPQNSRLHIQEEFNAGLFDYLIATDVNQSGERQQPVDNEKDDPPKKSKRHPKRKLDAEFGVARGIDFKNVNTVINFEMPQTAEGYIHRIGRTGRANNTGASVSLVSPEEADIFEEIKCENSTFIAPFASLTKNAVESLRYRAEDVSRLVTRLAVKEARAQDLRNEILNSDKLKSHFQDNPKDLDLLKHDKVLSKKEPAHHLRKVPDYLLDPTTEEASKIVKLEKEAMGNQKSIRRKGVNKGRIKKSKNPLLTFSAEGTKKFGKGGMKRKTRDGDAGPNRQKK